VSRFLQEVFHEVVACLVGETAGGCGQLGCWSHVVTHGSRRHSRDFRVRWVSETNSLRADARRSPSRQVLPSTWHQLLWYRVAKNRHRGIVDLQCSLFRTSIIDYCNTLCQAPCNWKNTNNDIRYHIAFCRPNYRVGSTNLEKRGTTFPLFPSHPVFSHFRCRPFLSRPFPSRLLALPFRSLLSCRRSLPSLSLPPIFSLPFPAILL